jgi:hypothetical protein
LSIKRRSNNFTHHIVALSRRRFASDASSQTKRPLR